METMVGGQRVSRRREKGINTRVVVDNSIVTKVAVEGAAQTAARTTADKTVPVVPAVAVVTPVTAANVRVEITNRRRTFQQTSLESQPVVGTTWIVLGDAAAARTKVDVEVIIRRAQGAHRRPVTVVQGVVVAAIG